ncbi:uncharacterized protein METZ01_LOCUS128077 [marine metagenome]|uniref:Uncharacterized protein n=1 Tax=marine metagenome TaxID=408172 RepID=A0A381YFB7_9ZZZZ
MNNELGQNNMVSFQVSWGKNRSQWSFSVLEGDVLPFFTNFYPVFLIELFLDLKREV